MHDILLYPLCVQEKVPSKVPHAACWPLSFKWPMCLLRPTKMVQIWRPWSLIGYCTSIFIRPRVKRKLVRGSWCVSTLPVCISGMCDRCLQVLHDVCQLYLSAYIQLYASQVATFCHYCEYTYMHLHAHACVLSSASTCLCVLHMHMCPSICTNMHMCCAHMLMPWPVWHNLIWLKLRAVAVSLLEILWRKVLV